MTSRYRVEEDVVHSVILEKTPSPPPPKPPRGLLRKEAPMKPQRSAIKIDPMGSENGDDKENKAKAPQQKFKYTGIMDQMQTYFKRGISMIRNSQEFTGTEAAEILTAFIETHRNEFQSENVGRKNAVMLLDVWRQQNFIQCVDLNQRNFIDSDRTFYRLGNQNEPSLYIASSPAPSDTESVNRSSSCRRNNSLKRFFSPFMRRNRSTSRNRNEKESNLKESSILKSTFSLFSSSDKLDKKVRRAEQQLIQEEEAEVYELALFHLLSIVEVEFLEDVALPIQDTNKSVSFLSSILEKVGFGAGGEDRLDQQEEEEMDTMIESHPLIKEAQQWFQMARCCAPLLQLRTTPDKGTKMQLFLWCKEALTAVSARLEKMTHNGTSPLFPVEFSPLLSKIAEQLISDVNSGERLNTAIMYLFLMVPHPLRITLDQIVHWLQLTMRTTAVEDLRSPYYLGRTEPRQKENVIVIVDELRPFLFPKGCMGHGQQNIFVETLIELRTKGLLGKRPEQLENSLRAKRSTNGDLTPVRFAVARESLRVKAQNGKNGLSETDAALVSMIEKILDDTKVPLIEKKKQLANFAKYYPELHSKFFKN